MAVTQEQRELRDRNEPTEKTCSACGELKPSSAYRPVPVGGRAHKCNQCIVDHTREVDSRLTNSDEVIQTELWRQYDRAENVSERIRCLEALVKLRPADKASSLDEPNVVAGLMKSLKARKKLQTQSDDPTVQ